jgi:hypothetical protein
MPALLFPIFLIFIYLFWCYEEVWGWAWHFGRVGVQHSHFPYTWEGEIFHSSWSLEISFFSKKFAKIVIHQDFLIRRWDFCLLKK